MVVRRGTSYAAWRLNANIRRGALSAPIVAPTRPRSQSRGAPHPAALASRALDHELPYPLQREFGGGHSVHVTRTPGFRGPRASGSAHQRLPCIAVVGHGASNLADTQVGASQTAPTTTTGPVDAATVDATGKDGKNYVGVILLIIGSVRRAASGR